MKYKKTKMPVNPGSKKCVGEEMHRFKAGELHSGTGKKGKKGPIVQDRKQAIAIALSACKKSNYEESLQSIGFSQKASQAVARMISDADWDKQFETGSTGMKTQKEDKTTKAVGLQDMDIDNRPGKQPGNQGKSKADPGELLGPAALPKGNPQSGPRSLQLKGMRSFQEPAAGLTTGKVCPPKKPRKTAQPKPQTMAQETKQPELPKAQQPETQKVEKKRKKCTPAPLNGAGQPATSAPPMAGLT